MGRIFIVDKDDSEDEMKEYIEERKFIHREKTDRSKNIDIPDVSFYPESYEQSYEPHR
jgi:hypothetical protein